MIIPDHNRATMALYREGCTLEEYLDWIWARREMENPRRARPRWPWPIRMGAQSNVTPLRACT